MWELLYRFEESISSRSALQLLQIFSSMHVRLFLVDDVCLGLPGVDIRTDAGVLAARQSRATTVCGSCQNA